MRKTFLPKNFLLTSWIITERVSKMKTAAINKNGMIESVSIAITPKVAPRE